MLEAAHGREMNMTFSQLANCTLPQNLRYLLCDKTTLFKVAFYCAYK
jgi:hypothetical protein